MRYAEVAIVDVYCLHLSNSARLIRRTPLAGQDEIRSQDPWRGGTADENGHVSIPALYALQRGL